MRYSRFRQQMEGTTGAARTKRKQKKAKIVDPPAEMQSTFPMAPTSSTSTMGPMNSSFQINPFIKSEPGTRGNLGLQNNLQYNPQSTLETHMHGQYYFPQNFASTQFQMVSNMHSRLSPSFSPAISSSFVNPYSSENVSTGYQLSSSGMQSDLDFRDVDMQNSCPNLLSTVPWEPQASPCSGGPIIRTEEPQQNGGATAWDLLSSHQPNVMTATSVKQYHPSPTITWEPQLASQQSTHFPRYEEPQSNLAITWESLASSQRNITAANSVEQRQRNSTVSWEPRPLPREVFPIIKSEEQQESNQIIALGPAPSPSQDLPAAQVEENQLNNRDITWDTLPPTPEGTSPEEPEQQPSNAMIIWQPPPPSNQAALAVELEGLPDTNMSTEWQPVSPTHQSISVMDIDEEEHSKELLVMGERKNQDLFVKVEKC
jgi:hypothetical protein